MKSQKAKSFIKQAQLNEVGRMVEYGNTIIKVEKLTGEEAKEFDSLDFEQSIAFLSELGKLKITKK